MVVISALLVAACGGEDKPDPQTVQKQDIQAKSDARNLASEIEVCFVENQTYSACKKPAGTELPLGSNTGQVEVKDASTTGYRIVAHSKSGNSFTLEKSASGGTKRTCETSGSHEGGCKAGRW